MEPICYVDELRQFYGEQGFPPYKWTINESAPLHRPTQPLSACTVAILV